MNKTVKIITTFLTFIIFFGSLPVYAVDINSLGLSIPSIQAISAAEKSSPKSYSDLAMEYPVDPNSYRLGPSDTVGVHIIIGDAELSVNHDLFIGADGKVFFPNIGAIYLSGLTLTQAQDKIEKTVKKFYSEPFKLFVMLNQPKKVKIYLSGMVKSPGPLAVYDSSRISEVIAQAGGIASGGSNRYVYIKRMGVNGENKILKADLFAAYRGRDLSKDIRIQSGDVVEVPDANNELISNSLSDSDDKLLFEGKESFVYVYGEVGNRGRFEFVPGRRVSDYISYAGGPTGKALLDFVSLTRHQGGKSEKYRINVSDIIYNGNYEKDMEVSGGDVINVPGNFFYFSDFASFANTILLALTLYGSLVK
ncbi:hypothetical protein A2246_03880 [candidate division WOR-1 bacterium RIFOXYA2_FULL_37_7]|nr:MAG: hypothetical protein A2246_03880 [candidate division WOR-1 bacterium RIFOXYA2_FULL_37_7]